MTKRTTCYVKCFVSLSLSKYFLLFLLNVLFSVLSFFLSSLFSVKPYQCSRDQLTFTQTLTTPQDTRRFTLPSHPPLSLPLSVSPFLILATFSLVLSSWAIRQREKSQLARGGNQTSFSCPFNTGINFLQG